MFVLSGLALFVTGDPLSALSFSDIDVESERSSEQLRAETIRTLIELYKEKKRDRGKLRDRRKGNDGKAEGEGELKRIKEENEREGEIRGGGKERKRDEKRDDPTRGAEIEARQTELKSEGEAT